MPYKSSQARNEQRKRYYLKNKEYLLKQNKEWREKSKVHLKGYTQRTFKSKKNSSLKRKYGIGIDQYNILLEIQNNTCYICGKSEVLNKSLAVDHNHETGKVRGLLCYRCNTALGFVEEKVEILQNMINYLNKHNGFTN
jgi:hypothetical protein